MSMLGRPTAAAESPVTREDLFPPPRSLYLHVPFCARRCGYCNFTVVAGRDDLIEAYLDAIEREMAWQNEPTEVDTIFFGGGTPTQLPGPDLRRLIRATRRWFPPTANCEWTVEANPADLDEEQLDLLAEEGVTRISLGVQSFHDQQLSLLERDHRLGDILRALEMARNKISQVNLDLIFAVPGQSLDDWKEELRLAVEQQADHISTYGLTFEKGTSFWSRRERGELLEIEDHTQRAMYEWAIDSLALEGWEHYEVSNFARPNRRCQHNEKCWKGAGYFAIGPGAASFVNGRRQTNHRSTTTWIKRVLANQSPVAQYEDLSAEDAMRERLVFGLRRREGVDLLSLAEQTGVDVLAMVGSTLDRYVAEEWLLAEGDVVRLTRQGLLLSDSLWPDLLN